MFENENTISLSKNYKLLLCLAFKNYFTQISHLKKSKLKCIDDLFCFK